MAGPTPDDAECRIVASKAGQFTIRVDPAKRMIRVSDLGVVTVAEVNLYLAELRAIFAQARRDWGQIRLLADLRKSPVRAQDAAERLRSGNVNLYRRGDRVALIVESSLLKMQLRRHLIAEYQELFVSETAAELWLCA